MKIDVFAHVLLDNYYKKMLDIDPKLPIKFPFLNNPVLSDMDVRRKYWDQETKQVISYMNVNPEDYCDPDQSASLCRGANDELRQTVLDHPDMFVHAVGMLPMNNIKEAVKIVEEFSKDEVFAGVQLFTRHLGKSIADPSFEELFKAMDQCHTIVWLHPVFDLRKPDNNLVFSWEYELSQAMLQLVQAGYIRKYPHIRYIVHHAGGMVPFFAGRVERILKKEEAEDFKSFYVDTAILGNSKALELAVSYYGTDHVLFGTDAPLGILPAGATKEIKEAIDEMPLDQEDFSKIYEKNYFKILGDK